MPAFITPQGWKGQLADWLMVPIMYALQGTILETPQRTHYWNNTKFERKILRDHLKEPLGLGFSGDPEAKEPRLLGFIPLFHMPIFGGWRKYVVLKGMTENEGEPWHIGWFSESGHVGVSNVPLTDKVRVTLGPSATTFFAVTADGAQLPLINCGEGRIGEAGEFRHVPLL